VAWAASGVPNAARSSTATTDDLIRSASQRMVIHGQASVHHHRYAGRLEPRGRLVVPDPHLHPHQPWTYFKQIVQQRGHELRAPEDVDDVDRAGGGRRRLE